MLIYKKGLYLLLIIILSFSVFGANFNVRNTSNNSQSFLYVNGSNGETHIQDLTAHSVNLPYNSGVINYVSPVSNGSGGVNLSSINVYCYENGLGSRLHLHTIPSLYNQALTDGVNTANYVSIDCNTDSYVITSDKKDFVTSNGQYIRYATIIRSGNNLHIESEVIYADSLNNRMEQRILDTDQYHITDTSTLSISVLSDWNVTHGSIEAYSGVYKDTIPATTSSERGFQVGHNSSGDWITTSAAPPKLNSTHFDNGTGWQQYTTGYYGMCYYYLGVENSAHVYFRCPQEFASQELAKASNQFPSNPKLITEHTVYVGRIIFQESNSSNVLIQTSSEVVGSATPVSNHNSLSGLNTGGYYHLNDTQTNVLSSYLLSNDQRYNDTTIINNYFQLIADPTGFKDTTTTILSLNQSTLNFSITPTSTNYSYYINGTQCTKTSDSVIVPNTTGKHFIYYNSCGNLIRQTTPWGFEGTAMVGIVYVSNNSGSMYGDERHDLGMDWKTHKYLHNTIGTRYFSGLTGVFSNTGFNVTSGNLYDENLELPISNTSTARVMYRNTANGWEWLSNQTQYYYKNATNMYYDNGGVLTPVGVNNFMAVWIFGTNDPVQPIISILGQRTDTTIANARNNNDYGSLSFGDLPFAEYKILYRVILKNDATPYEEVLDYRSVSNAPSSTYVATDHGLLTGLLDDDHTQYLLVDGSRNMSGNLLFNTGFGLNWSYLLNIPSYIINYTPIINSIGNWTQDKVNYNTTTQLQTLFLNGSNYTQLDNKINSIGNWTQDKVNYNTTTQLRTIFANQSVYGNCGVGQVVQNITANGPQCVVDQSGTGGGNPFNQVLNTTSNVSFNNITIASASTIGGSLICTAGNGACSASVPPNAQFTTLNVTTRTILQNVSINMLTTSGEQLDVNGSIGVHAANNDTFDTIELKGNSGQVYANHIVEYAPSNRLLYEDDYFGAARSTSTLPTTLAAISSGTTAVVAITGDVARFHPGVHSVSSSTTASSGAVHSANTAYWINGSEYYETIFAKGTKTGNKTLAYFGLQDSTSAALPVDGIYFEIDNLTLRGVVAANSVRTNTTTNYSIVESAGTTWYKGRIEVNSAATSATFYLYNSTSGNTNLLWNATISTGTFPTGASRETAIGDTVYVSGGTTAQVLYYYDYRSFGKSITIAR